MTIFMYDDEAVIFARPRPRPASEVQMETGVGAGWTSQPGFLEGVLAKASLR